MRNLVRAELNRLRSRRLTLVMAVVALLGVALFQLAVNDALQPPSPADVASAQAAYERDLEAYNSDPGAKQAEQDCLNTGAGAQECQFKPQPDNYLPPQGTLVEMGRTSVDLATFVAGLAAFLMGASFVGAEFGSGSLSNWLTVVPRRGQVLVSKLVALALGSGLLGTACLAVAVAVPALLASGYDLPQTGLRALAGSGGRGVAMVVGLALAGFAIALATRHTAAAIGVLVAYGLVNIGLNILYFLVPGLQKLKSFAPENTLLAFVNGAHTYDSLFPGPTSDSEGQVVSHTISLADGGLYWLVVLAALLTGAWLLFRRRDLA
ncbi:MAG: transporter permease [Friedmanniella sp.]|nr:transporter permease [Friedmanniella sp.]